MVVVVVVEHPRMVLVFFEERISLSLAFLARRVCCLRYSYTGPKTPEREKIETLNTYSKELRKTIPLLRFEER